MTPLELTDDARRTLYRCELLLDEAIESIRAVAPPTPPPDLPPAGPAQQQLDAARSSDEH